MITTIGGILARMSMTKRLRDLLARPQPLMAPGAADALTARLIARQGFEAIYMTGAGTSAVRLGMPDVGLLTMGEMVDNAQRIAEASQLPLVADADTGYGGPINVQRTVRAYERAGVAGIHIEDQQWPKRCGHLAGKAVAEEGAAGRFDKRIRDAEHMMCQPRIAARAVRRLGFELVVRHLRDDAQCGVDEMLHPLDELRRRQYRPGLFVELQEGDDLRDVLRKDELVAARQHRNRTRAEALQLGPAGGVFEDIDRLELDPTDREKLLESQAAGSARLPERLQWCSLGHARFLPWHVVR